MEEGATSAESYCQRYQRVERDFEWLRSSSNRTLTRGEMFTIT